MAAVSLIGSCVFVGAASTASAAPTTAAAATSSPAQFWVIGSPEESFSKQVQRTIAQDPASAPAVASVLASLEASLAAGKDVSLPGPATTVAEKLTSVKDASTTAASARQGALASPNSTLGTTYELRGYAINSNHTWQVNTEIDAVFCDGSGCSTKAATRQTWKISPGRTGDTFSFTSIYTGQAGALTHIYANLDVLCNGSPCGTGTAGSSGPQDGSGSGNPIVTHSSAAGKSVIDRVQMHATLAANGTSYYDSVKTGTASCGSGSNYSCTF